MSPGRLQEIRLDERTWSSGSAARRQEWRLAIEELLTEGRFVFPKGEAARAAITLAPSRLAFDVSTPDAAETLAHRELPLEVLRPLMNDYMETITEMAKLGVSANSPRLEALDIAKRITHDEAGELVSRLLVDLCPDHATARRLFTLFVTLVFDTTRQAHPQRHQ